MRLACEALGAESGRPVSVASELGRRSNRRGRRPTREEWSSRKEVSLDGSPFGENADFRKQLFRSPARTSSNTSMSSGSRPRRSCMDRATHEGFARSWPTRERKNPDGMNAVRG